MNRVGGAFAAVAVVAAGAVALDIDPSVVTQVAPTVDGVWVTAEETGEIVRIDGPTGEPTARVTVAEPGNQLDVVESDEVLAAVDLGTGTVMAVDRALHQVDRSVTTELGAVELVDVGPGGVALAQGTDIALVDSSVVAATALSAPEPVRALAVDGDAVVAAHDTGVTRVDTDGVDEIDDEAEDPGVVRARDTVVWSHDTRLRPLSGGGEGCLDTAVGSDAQWVGSPDGVVAVADPAAGTVQLSSLDDGWCRSIELTEPGTPLGRPAIAMGSVFVPEPGAGAVHIVDIDGEGEPRRALIGASGPRLRLHTRGDVVVAHDPESSRGAVLDTDGVVARIDSSPEASVTRATLGESGPSAVASGEGDTPSLEFEGSTTVAEGEGDAAAPSADGSEADGIEEIEGELTDELVANFAFSSDIVDVGEEVRFVDESTGSPTSWVWDFGDGTGATGPSVDKSWDSTGTFTVTLIVARDDETAQATLDIVVVDPDTERRPTADFDVSATTVGVGDTVQFTDTSTGDVDRRLWEFGGGVTSEDANPTMSWDAPGAYTVTLTVANDLGSNSASVVIDVVADLAPPVADIVSAPASVEAGQRVDLVGRSTGGPAELRWTFGDGGTATGTAVSHVYDSPGRYTVRLDAVNAAGAARDTVVIEVRPGTAPPVARIAALPTLIEVGDTVTLTSLATNDPDTELWSFGDGSTATGSTVQHTWTRDGTFIVTLTASNEAGSHKAEAVVTVVPALPPPIAAIGIVPEGATANPVAGQYTLLVDESLHATAWSWQVDGQPVAATQNHRHLFSSAGEHTVTLVVSNRNGQHTITVPVTVYPPLQATFSVPGTQPTAGQPSTFVDQSTGATSWSWTVDGVPVSTLPDLVYTFPAAGTYEVVLTVANANGTASETATVIVDPIPPVIASIVTDPLAPVTLEPVTITATLADPAAPVSFWVFDFGDGSALHTSASPTVTHTYASADSYVVEVAAQGPVAPANLSRTITVTDPPPPAFTIGVAPDSPAVGDPTSIAATVSAGSGPITSWRWTVDGAAVGGTGPSFTTTFATPGAHTVVGTAVGPVAETEVTRTITVRPPPDPVITGITPAPTTGTVGLPTTFSAGLTGGPVSSWSWNFGDGNTSTQQSPVHTYGAPNTYTVTLTVTGPFGGSATATIPYTVVAPPAILTPVASNPTPVVGEAVTFTSGPAAGSGPISSWQWTVDGATVPGSSSVLTYAFPTDGPHTVTAIATGPTGAVSTQSTSVTVTAAPPVAAFTFTPLGALGVQFIDQSVGGGPVTSWSWNFGDGVGVSTQQSPSYTYAVPNTYTVTLTVSGPGGTSAPVSQLVTVA